MPSLHLLRFLKLIPGGFLTRNCAAGRVRIKALGTRWLEAKIPPFSPYSSKIRQLLIGIVLAFLGIFLSQVFDKWYFDPIASILIGVLLACVAFVLGRESGALLVGERTNRSKIRRIRTVILEDEDVEDVGDILTMQLGPEQVLVTASIRFRRGEDVQELESAITRIETAIRKAEPSAKRIILEPSPQIHGSRRAKRAKSSLKA